MNPGFRNWPRNRHKVFVGEPQTIDSTNGNTFRHGFGRVPGNVQVRLLVTAATANGYSKGEEVPIDLIIRNATSDTDGCPRYTIRISVDRVLVLIVGTSVNIVDSSGAPAAVTLTNYKLVVRCDDIERVL